MTQEEKEREMYDQLALYTLAQAQTDPSFMHQNIVDVYALQHANQNSRPISIAFALIGLYLYLEKNFSGKEVQQMHMLLARERREWPTFKIPNDMGSITVVDVMTTPQGAQRDEMIKAWCQSVWDAWGENHEQIHKLVQFELNKY